MPVQTVPPTEMVCILFHTTYPRSEILTEANNLEIGGLAIIAKVNTQDMQDTPALPPLKKILVQEYMYVFFFFF